MRFGFLLADHEQRRNFRQRMFTDLVVDLLVAQVDLDTQARASRSLRDYLGVLVAFRGDRGDDRLDRREPEREVAGIVLDQDADETLQRAQIARWTMTGAFLEPSSSM